MKESVSCKEEPSAIGGVGSALSSGLTAPAIWASWDSHSPGSAGGSAMPTSLEFSAGGIGFSEAAATLSTWESTRERIREANRGRNRDYWEKGKEKEAKPFGAWGKERELCLQEKKASCWSWRKIHCCVWLKPCFFVLALLRLLLLVSFSLQPQTHTQRTRRREREKKERERFLQIFGLFFISYAYII